MKFQFTLFTVFLFFILPFQHSRAQDEKLSLDYSKVMEMPELVSMKASPSHLYILSDEEGMAVFRAYPDTLQWLYTSSGMQRRGNRIMADIRFAYLFGKSRRLTVLEPTSVLGVYSSAILPAEPRAVGRIDNYLYIAMGSKGLGVLPLETPESVDSPVNMLAKADIAGAEVLDLQSSDVSKQLFVLLDSSTLLIYSANDGELHSPQRIPLSRPLHRIFISDDDLWGSTADGKIFEITERGLSREVGNAGAPVTDIGTWNSSLFVRTAEGKIWTDFPDGNLKLWKNDSEAGNYLATTKNRLWVAENNNIAEVNTFSPVAETNLSGPVGSLDLKEIPNQIISFPNPMLLAIELEGSYPVQDVDFSYRSSVKNARIRKQGLYWQPTSSQVGMHWFTVLATSSDGETDSTHFMVDVRSFNAPPRFAPVRNASIAVNDPYTLQFKAVDPENPESNLIRYLGVDLPDGATIDEKTGEFNWTPDERQIGESTFKVIATDRLGAATSLDVTLKVLNISRGDSQK